MQRGPILALAGGVGGARLANGLAQVLEPSELAVVVNVGDDFVHMGLSISPDLDTVMYTLAGLVDLERGWGRSAETWNFMEAVEQLGGSTWFRLGDKDLAVHVERTRRLRAGESLSAVTSDLCAELGIRHAVMPVTDASLRTTLVTDCGELDFQDYFVRQRCEPRVLMTRYEGADAAQPSTPLERLLSTGLPRAVILCPSNPWLSIAPLTAVPALREVLYSSEVPVVAVSPIVGGAAVKGPAAKIMRELGIEVSAIGIAHHYGALVDGWVIDETDTGLAKEISTAGHAVAIRDTVMTSQTKAVEVAQAVLDLIELVEKRP